jgi:FG-GAP-like repeat
MQTSTAFLLSALAHSLLGEVVLPTAWAQGPCSAATLVATEGPGTLGSFGFPELSGVGAPAIGAPFAVRVSSAVPGGLGWIAFGLAQAPIPLPEFGAVYFAGAPLALQSFPLDASGASGPLFPLPAVKPGFCGLELILQSVILDAGATGGLAFTRGLRVRFGQLNAGEVSTFPALETYSGQSITSEQPRQVLGLDFDRDALEDLLIVDRSGQLWTLRGLGDGSFAAAVSFAVPGFASSMASADFNQDGWTDVAVGLDAPGPNAVQVLLGSPGMGFQAPFGLPQPGPVFGLATGDLNQDGKQDIAATASGPNRVAVLLGSGLGSFVLASTLPANSVVGPVAIGDLDGDGLLDLVNSTSDTQIEVRRGVGAGAFSPPAAYTTGFGVSSIRIADLDLDGKQDLAVAYSGLGFLLPGGVAVLRGQGGALFSPAINLPAGTGARDVAVSDVDLDGKPDLVVANDVLRQVSVLRGQGGTSYAPLEAFAVGDQPRSLVVRDFNQNGAPDVVVLNAGSRTVTSLIGRGDGTFLACQPFSFPVASGYQGNLGPALDDLNGDGLLDALVTQGILPGFLGIESRAAVLLGQVGGGFQPGQVLSLGQPSTEAIPQLALLNADGNPDLVVLHGSSTNPALFFGVALGQAGGTFAAIQNFPCPWIARDLALGDVNGDGTLDAVLARATSGGAVGEVAVQLGVGNGTFVPAQITATGSSDPRSVLVRDLNLDGLGDVVAQGIFNVSILYATGGGAFAAPVLNPGANAIATGDFNGDGRPDLLSIEGANAVVRLGLSGGGFAAPLAFTYTNNTNAGVLSMPKIADLDGDGLADVLGTLSNLGGRLLFLRGLGDGSFSQAQLFGLNQIPLGLALGDVSQDGRLDALVATTQGVTSSFAQ